MPVCQTTVTDPKTLSLCNNTPVTPTTVAGPLVAKIPVVLAEVEVQIDTEATINFQEPFSEIKRITKDVYLTQCKIIPGTGVVQNGIPVTGKLFLAGFVRKNIQYVYADCVSTDVVSGAIRDISVDVPFQCVTEINYITPPVFTFSNVETSLEFTCTENTCQCEDTTLGRIPCEQVFNQTILFNEKPFCELISARIYEYDINREPAPINSNFPDRLEYDSLTEKMVIYLTLKVLQLQQVDLC
ncbi:CsxC family protein [Haloimpatiens massiliensis]|uniref:CsxC family protein n=1 Tax=Haloimpatiens massiliensis TaxID=1658110 RepID=UPI000C85476E|nr:hypothetical protein [Haloimpatiens massiliensis]